MSRYLLAIESGGERVGAALLGWPASGDLPVLAERGEPAERDQGRRLVPMIDRLCREADVRLADLAAVAVGRGPGAYTGLRVGMATALGLGVAGGAQVFGVESLRAAAFAGHGAGLGPIVVVSAAGRGGWYAQAFEWPATAAVPAPAGDAERVATEALGALLDRSGEGGGGSPAVVAIGQSAAAAALASRGPGAAMRVLEYLGGGAVGRLALTLIREGVTRHGQALAVAPIYLRPAATATRA